MSFHRARTINPDQLDFAVRTRHLLHSLILSAEVLAFTPFKAKTIAQRRINSIRSRLDFIFPPKPLPSDQLKVYLEDCLVADEPAYAPIRWADRKQGNIQLRGVFNLTALAELINRGYIHEPAQIDAE